MSGQQFIYKPCELSQDKRLTPLEQDYLCLIAGLQQAGGCTASNNYFARYFGVSRTAAVEVISLLKRKGFIDSSEKKQGKKTVERTIWIIDENSRQTLLTNSRQTRPKGIVGKHGAISRVYPNHITKGITNRRISAHTKSPVCETDETFQRFIEVYPRKENKQGAFREWKKLKPGAALAERIIEDVKRRSQTRDWLKDDGKYIPLPKNYLHDHRWEDELPEPKRGDADWLPTEEEAEELMKK
jgi:hypothetical protein